MAKVKVINDQLTLNTLSKLNWTAGTTDGFQIDYTPADHKMVILFQNTGSGAGTVTVKQGNGIQGVADSETFSIAAGEFAAVRLDSGAFKRVNGEDKDMVLVIPSATTIKACAIQLP